MKSIFFAFLLLPFFAKSQNKAKPFPFEKGSQIISVQYGFPNLIKKSLESFPGFTESNKKSTGPVSLSYEYHFRPLLSLGISVSYSAYSAEFKDMFGFNAAFTGKLRNIALMLQTVKYFDVESNFLFYTKAKIGLNLWSGEYTNANGSTYKNFNAPTPVASNLMLGAKYPFSKSVIAYLEAGYGKYIMAAGVSFPLK